MELRYKSFDRLLRTCSSCNKEDTVLHGVFAPFPHKSVPLHPTIIYDSLAHAIIHGSAIHCPLAAHTMSGVRLLGGKIRKLIMIS